MPSAWVALQCAVRVVGHGRHFGPKEEPLTRLREVIATADTRIHHKVISINAGRVDYDAHAAIVDAFSWGSAAEGVMISRWVHGLMFMT